MSIRIFKKDDVQLDKLKYKKSGNIIQILNHDLDTNKTENIYLLTPKMRYSLPVKYDKLRITIFFKNMESSFYNILERFDKYIPKLVYANRKTWFPEDFHDFTLEEFVENYHSSLKIAEKEETNEIKRSITLGLWTDQKSGKIAVPIYDQNKKQLGVNELEHLDPFQEIAFSGGFEIILLVKCRGIWILEETYGISWEITQIKLFN